MNFNNLESAVHEVKWLRNLPVDISLGAKLAPSYAMYCDSQAAIAVGNNQACNEKNMHIRLRHNAVKDLLSNEVISPDYLKS